MIAMQYTIRFAGDYDNQLLLDRVARRKSLFEGLDGVLHKAYLFNSDQAIYAPFYVWENDDAARAFLTGDLFRDVVDTFGRPRVRCWGVIAFSGVIGAGAPKVAVKELDAIPAEEALADLLQREEQLHAQAVKTDGLCFHLAGIDPDRWELMRYSAWCDPSQVQNCNADAVESFDILQLSRSESVA